MEQIDQTNFEISKDFNVPSTVINEVTLEDYRLSQDFESLIGVKKEILTVPVRKPDKQSFIQVHPGEDWRMSALILELKEDREHYLVNLSLISALPEEFVPKYLFTCQTRQGVTFLWPVRMPGSEGRLDTWNESALLIVKEYAGRWIRVVSNMGLGAYEVIIPNNDFPSPNWPAEGFKSLLRKAFRRKIIDSLEHPVIKSLRGVN